MKTNLCNELLMPKGSHFSCFAKKSNPKKATPTFALIRDLIASQLDCARIRADRIATLAGPEYLLMMLVPRRVISHVQRHQQNAKHYSRRRVLATCHHARDSASIARSYLSRTNHLLNS